MSDDAAEKAFALRCPFCDGEMSATLEYTGWAYSEHRDWKGWECDDCDATWSARGEVSRWPTSCSVVSALAYRARVAPVPGLPTKEGETP